MNNYQRSGSFRGNLSTLSHRRASCYIGQKSPLPWITRKITHMLLAIEVTINYNQSTILLDDSILSTIPANNLGAQDKISKPSV
jgi:hypothetical protein